jgi:histidinol-phosphate aminotransferase
VEALRHQDRVAGRVARNTAAVRSLSEGLRALGVEIADSQANFVYAGFGVRGKELGSRLLERGFIVRPVPPEGWLRITAGTPEENARLMAAIQELTADR